MHAYIIRKSFAKLLGPALRRPSRNCSCEIPPDKRAAIDVILSDHHQTYAAYAVWPPMAWQAEGLSNIEQSYRGNYHPEGRQRIYEHAIAHLPWEGNKGISDLSVRASELGMQGQRIHREAFPLSDEGNSCVANPEKPGRLSIQFPQRVSKRRLHLGCGGNRLEGWENLDLPRVDIRRKLLFGDGSAEAIFLEHVIEHVTPQEGYLFFEDCLRVLEPGGVLRLAFPDPVRILHQATPDYLAWQKRMGWGDGTPASGVRAALFQHGHRNVCTAEILTCLLESLGYEVKEHRPRESDREDLRNLESHGYADPAMWASTLCQTTCLEARKPG